MTRCAECGAEYTAPDDSCAARFDQLLALDHSRQEPWGSRHGLAFAVFALQHPARFGAGSEARSFEMLDRVFTRGEAMETVIAEFRARGGAPSAAPRLVRRAGPYAVTIADLGAFDAATYAADLDRWCRATLAHM